MASLSPVNESSLSPGSEAEDSSPAFRYDASLADQIEVEWQRRWLDEGTYQAANPSGPLSGLEVDARPKLFVMDMFPYPSGSGLHVGHPLGYIGTDVFCALQENGWLQRPTYDGI